MRQSTARRLRLGGVLAVVLAAGQAHAQAATWFLRGGGGAVHLAGPAATALHGLAPAPVTTPDGEWVVHFGPDALGKPGSLPLVVPEGAVVNVAVEPAAPADQRSFALDDPRWIAAGAARWLDAGDEHDYCIAAQGTANAGNGSFGIVARWVDAQQHYRFVWDLAKAELRLERQFGKDALVLARRPAPVADGAPHTLALQAQGFRLQAFCDDAPVLQVLDGAIGRGGFGRWDSGDAVRWMAFAAQEPMTPRASSAVVATPGAATFVAATAVAAGHVGVVMLALDRPHGLVPRTAAGGELWLLQRPAAPQVLLGDWRGSLGRGAVGEVARDGLAQAELHWPQLPALRLQAALATMLLVSPNGDVLVGRTPPVPVWF